MRIISGKYKGRHIPVRKNFPSRPTTDFAKENLFNVLNNHFDFEHLQVLDLFSGTGSISYEFASRGAMVDLVEKDFRSIEFIRETIRDLQFANINPYKTDVFRALLKLSKTYDIIFADPPFMMNNIGDLPDLVFNLHLLNMNGWFILEHSDKFAFNAHENFSQLRKYGSVHFSIFVNKSEQ